MSSKKNSSSSLPRADDSIDIRLSSVVGTTTDCPLPDAKRQRSLASCGPTSLICRQNIQQVLPLEMWMNSFQYLTGFEVGCIMHHCETFFQAGAFRLRTPLRVPGDAPSLEVALKQITVLRKDYFVHRESAVHSNKIVLGPGDYTLPKTDCLDATNAEHQLEIFLDDIEISGTIQMKTKTSAGSLKNSEDALQDSVLKSSFGIVFEIATDSCDESNSSSIDTFDASASAATVAASAATVAASAATGDGNCGSPLQSRVHGRFVISGGKRVVLSKLQVTCDHDSAIIVALSSEVEVKMCHIHHCDRTGIVAKGSSLLAIEECVVSNNADDALKVEGHGTRAAVRSSHFLFNYDGVWCRKGGQCDLQNTNIFNHDGVGVRVENSESLASHADCHIFQNVKSNIQADLEGSVVGVNV